MRDTSRKPQGFHIRGPEAMDALGWTLEEGEQPEPETQAAPSLDDAIAATVAAGSARHFGSGPERHRANYERFMAGARGEQPTEQPKTRPEWEKQAVEKLATASDAHLDSLRRVLDAAELSKLGVEDYGDGVEELPTMTDAEYEAEMAEDPVFQSYSYDELTSEAEGDEA